MYNASERKDVRIAEKEARRAERERQAVVSSLMSSSGGRRYVLEALERAHVFASSFNTNALTMAFTEGERNCGLQLLNDIMASCPDQYVAMMQERNERDARTDTLLRRSGHDPDDASLGDDAPNDYDRDPVEFYNPSQRRSAGGEA